MLKKRTQNNNAESDNTASMRNIINITPKRKNSGTEILIASIIDGLFVGKYVTDSVVYTVVTCAADKIKEYEFANYFFYSRISDKKIPAFAGIL